MGILIGLIVLLILFIVILFAISFLYALKGGIIYFYYRFIASDENIDKAFLKSLDGYQSFENELNDLLNR